MNHKWNHYVNRIFFLFLLLTTTALFTGCSPEKKEKETITIAEQYGFAYAPLQVMKEKGFLEEIHPGAEVNWVRLGNTAAIREAVQAGDVDAGFMGIPPLLIARDQGMEWKIATGLSRSPLGLVVATSKIRTLDDFTQGTRIALPQPGSIQHILLTMALEREYGDPNRLDHQLVSLKHPDGLNSLIGGSIEGHFTSPPYIFQESDQTGFDVLLTGEEAMGGPFTFIVGMVTEDFYRNQRALYDDYLEAVTRAVNFIEKNPVETVRILAKAYGMEEDLVNDYLYRPGMVFETEVLGLQNFINFMRTADYLEKIETGEEVLF